MFNFHFSLLPKFRGCHTNFYQIYFGEKKSGVTLHKIDNGIDTGAIISKIQYKIKINDNALSNYKNLMKYSFLLFKKILIIFLKKNIRSKNNYTKNHLIFHENQSIIKK